MTRRFAGDIFNRPLGAEDRESGGSFLLRYFPEFKDFTKPIGERTPTDAARSTGGHVGIPAFGGFTPLKRKSSKESPVFAGSKPSGYASVRTPNSTIASD